MPRYGLEEMLFLRDVQAAEESWDDTGDALTLSWTDGPPLTLRMLSKIRVQVVVNTELKPVQLKARRSTRYSREKREREREREREKQEKKKPRKKDQADK